MTPLPWRANRKQSDIAAECIHEHIERERGRQDELDALCSVVEQNTLLLMALCDCQVLACSCAINQHLRIPEQPVSKANDVQGGFVGTKNDDESR